MRRPGCWPLQAALLAVFGLVAVAAAADPPDGDSQSADKNGGSPGWFQWLTPASKKPDKKAVAKAADEADKKPDPVAEAAAQRAREQAAYLRRVAVCDRLMEIAAQRNDEALGNQAEQLSNRAFEVYSQRVARLPGGAGTEPLAAGPDRTKESKLEIAGQPLGGAGQTYRKSADSPKEEIP